MEKLDYSPLFTPFKIGSMEVKNRIVLSPMGHNASLPYGAKAESEIAYYEERARGGVGLIMTGCTNIDKVTAQARSPLGRQNRPAGHPGHRPQRLPQ